MAPNPNMPQPYPPPSASNQNPMQVGTLPSSSQLQPDLTGQSYAGSGLPTIRVMPASANANAAINSISQTVTQNVTNVVIPTIPPPNFGDIKTGQNLQATMIVGTGAFLGYANYFVNGGVFGNLAFIQGEKVVQAVSGATSVIAAFYNGQIQLGPIVGAPNSTGAWVGQTSGATYIPNALPSASTGVVNANEIGTIVVDGNVPSHAGQLLISQPGNETAVWADPQVQGLYAAGSSIASPPVYSVPTTICPVGVGGSKAGVLQYLLLDSSGNLQVSLGGSTTVTVQGNLTNNNAAPSTNNLGVLPNLANAAAPSWTEGDMVLGSVNLSGDQRVIAKQGTSPWVENVSQFGGSAVVTGTGASGAGIPRVTVSNDSKVIGWDATNTWTIKPANTVSADADTSLVVQLNPKQPNLDVALNVSLPSNQKIEIWDGTTVVGVVAATAAFKTDTTSVAGTATNVAAAGTQLVGVADGSGNKLTSNSGTVTGSVKALDVNIVGAKGNTISATNPIWVLPSDGTSQMQAMWGFGAAASNGLSLPVNASLYSGTTPLQNTGGALNVELVGLSGLGTSAWGTAPAGGTIVIDVNSYIFAGNRPLDSTAGSSAATAGQVALVTQISPNQPTALFNGVTPSAAPQNTILVGGVYPGTTPFAPTAGQASPLQQNIAGALLVAGGYNIESTATWTSATAGNTALTQTVSGYGSLMVLLNQGTTIAAGVVTFEVSDAASGIWYALQGSASDGSASGSTYTLTASTNISFQFNVAAYAQFRVRLSTAITGSANVNVSIQAMAFGGGGGGGGGTTNLTKWAGTTLGAPTNFGTTPTAVVAGSVNASIFAGTTALTQTGSALDVNLKTSSITLPVSIAGTVSVTQGTSPWVVSNGGTFAVQEATLDAALIAQEATTSGVKGLTAFGAVTTNAPTYVTAKSDALSLDTSGNLRVSVKDSPANTNKFLVTADPITFASAQPVTVASVGATGTTVPTSADFIGWQQGTNLVGVSSAAPLPIQIIQNQPDSFIVSGQDDNKVPAPLRTDSDGGLILSDQTEIKVFGSNGSPYVQTNLVTAPNGLTNIPSFANFGSSNTNAAAWTTSTAQNTAVTLINGVAGYSSISVTLNQAPSGTLSGGVVTFETSNDGQNWYSIAGADPSALATVGPTYTLVAATYSVFVFTLPAPFFRVRLSTAITGSGTVTVGYAADTLPTIHNFAGTISGSLGSVYNSTAPAPSATATVNLQSDYVGDLFVKPFRRSQTVTTPTTIASSNAATTVMAAQGAGVYADLSNLVVTPTAQATGVAFTITLSDGTQSFIYDMNTGSTTTLQIQPPLNINWNPTKPATATNTAWTIALSSASVTVHIDVTAVLQKAS